LHLYVCSQWSTVIKITAGNSLLTVMRDNGSAVNRLTARKKYSGYNPETPVEEGRNGRPNNDDNKNPRKR